jgi:glycosyltransferase involved in cell wall biosynthesis
MHIVMASAYHLSHYYGGNEHYAHYLAGGLAETKNVKVTYLTAFSKPYPTPYTTIVKPVSLVLGKPFVSRNWTKALKQTRFDLYHAAGSGLPLMHAAYWLKQNRPRVPRILTFQADSYPPQFFYRAAALLEQRYAINLFTHIITTTPHYRQLLKKRFPHHIVTCIPLFVSDAFLSHKPKSKKTSASKRILFVGQLDSHHYYKGLPVLLHSLAKLPSHITLTVIGSGSKSDTYIKLAQQIKVLDRVTFLGHLPHHQLPPYINQADVFVLPSTSQSEGFGMAALEAMTQKVPVITTDKVGSASWFKRHRVAIIVPANDSHRLAEAIDHTVSVYKQEMVSRAYHFSKTYTQATMVAQTKAFYETIL